MLRSGTGAVPRAHASVQPQFALRGEINVPRLPCFCLLVRRGDVLEAIVNAAFGPLGYLHAEFHTERGLTGTLVCQPNTACGYDGPSADDERSWRDAMT